jgi:hypothetical protein
LHKKLQRENRRQKFRKHLNENEIAEKKFGHSIVVPWSEDWRVEDSLGQQLEALDEIRMDGLCYITFMRKVDECLLSCWATTTTRWLRPQLASKPFRFA